MLEKLTECIITTLLILIKLYKMDKLDYILFKSLSEQKIDFLVDNYDEISKIGRFGDLDKIVSQCQLILKFKDDENMIVL